MNGLRLPDINLKVAPSGEVNLNEIVVDSPVLLFFYPKDDTEGCTIEAKSFTEHIKKFEETGVKLYGINSDNFESHAKFQEKYQLKTPLIVDEGNVVADFFDVYGELSYKGQKYMGLSRDLIFIEKGGAQWKIVKDIDPSMAVNKALELIS